MLSFQRQMWLFGVVVFFEGGGGFGIARDLKSLFFIESSLCNLSPLEQLQEFKPQVSLSNFLLSNIHFLKTE